jgi:LDH2 family malate/lactate/ureidoglycolate dehydrogenase
MLGTSPLCAGAPGGARGPFLLDMATAVAARGKIRRAQRRGEAIPLGYALDAEGRPTTDPVKALEGVVLPVGEHKGSGISMLMDILGGVVAGAACAGEVRDQYKDFSAPQNVGHFFLAMRPDLFVPLDEYRARMDRLVERVKSCPPAEGFAEVLMPGEPELRCAAERRRRGIPLSRGEVDALDAEAAKSGVPPIAVADAPLGS